MIDYYDVDGKPITLMEWARLLEARGEDMAVESWWRRWTRVSEEVDVSTVWLGLNHQWDPDGPPLVWETMVFGGAMDGCQWRYTTRAEAFDGHERVLAEVRLELVLTATE